MKMHDKSLFNQRSLIREVACSDQEVVLQTLLTDLAMTTEERALAHETAKGLVARIRRDEKLGLMEAFLTKYGLSTDEGIALMCLAEALLRVPDSATMDSLIEDKLVLSTWHEHVGKSRSTLVNTATLGLLLTGKVLDDSQKNNIARSLRGAIKRLGEPVVRAAVRQAMKFMGQQFVLGESIDSALARAEKKVDQGYTYSFDMLGEAALTQQDAQGYFESYHHAIEQLALNAQSDNVKDNPGISIKLSALHPRYEATQHKRVLNELVPIVLKLAQSAKNANIGLNIDAEEADRVDLSLDVIQAVFEDPRLGGWDGFGVVVQAYNKCASAVLDWVYTLARDNDRKIMVRLVKGAYWDTEIKRAQVDGLRDYPVFTNKAATDVSYLCCAKKLLLMGDRVYPQFATHNAQTIASILAIAGNNDEYEFQRLHGMGERVFQLVLESYPARCRIYAPVGKHKNLLAYLVRRLLENGANSSFVNQVVDLSVSIEDVVADPFAKIKMQNSEVILPPSQLFFPERLNSRGWDLHDHMDVNEFHRLRDPYLTAQWQATPLVAGPDKQESKYTNAVTITNPSQADEIVGEVIEADLSEVEQAINSAESWDKVNLEVRSEVLLTVANLFEENSGELFAILSREAGKTPTDAIAEVREAVDFLRYYATQARSSNATNSLTYNKKDSNENADNKKAVNESSANARGIFVCISPWNFPLAIFTGQIAAALAAGNGVLAKPAETTPLIAFFAVTLFYKAGVPREVLQLLPGQGTSVGEKLVSSSKINGICFTGSTQTGRRINRRAAQSMTPDTPVIAETGGLNAMIVDSTALPEQAVSDIVRSAFQSAGQRCSALRLLYLQEDVYQEVLDMLFGAMDELTIGDPWSLSTDLGPLISNQARQRVQSYIDEAYEQGRLLKMANNGMPANGHFVAPSLIKVSGINDMHSEVFGPVLHIAKFTINTLDQIIEDLNASGYGLTFGLHTRIDSRVEHIVSRLNVGNIYVNRDQVGAVVGSQPFGGENLSGTGPKAGGPNYLSRFSQHKRAVTSVTLRNFAAPSQTDLELDLKMSLDTVQTALDSLSDSRVLLSEKELTGPTGESNKLYEYGRGIVLCLGPDIESANQQAKIANENGCQALIVCPHAAGENAIDGFLNREMLSTLNGFSVVVLWGSHEDTAQARQALAAREGKIIPLVCDDDLAQLCRVERHVCIDTTAAGGNVSLLA